MKGGIVANAKPEDIVEMGQGFTGRPPTYSFAMRA